MNICNVRFAMTTALVPPLVGQPTPTSGIQAGSNEFGLQKGVQTRRINADGGIGGPTVSIEAKQPVDAPVSVGTGGEPLRIALGRDAFRIRS